MERLVMSEQRSSGLNVFDNGHYANTFFKKVKRSLHLGPKYFLWDLPTYFLDRMTLHLPLRDSRAFMNPVREFRRRVYWHFDLPPRYEEALRLLARAKIRLTMP